MVAGGGALGNWVKKERGLRNTDWGLQNGRGDTKQGTGTAGSNVVTV